MLFREIIDVCSDILTKQKIGCVVVSIIFGCLRPVEYEVTAGVWRAEKCRQLVDNLPELRSSKCEAKMSQCFIKQRINEA